MGVALENARLFDETQRLLKETEQRAAELAIINSVQEGLASKLDMQAIYELVGDKLREVLNSQDIDIRLFDPDSQRVFFPYLKDRGQRICRAAGAIARCREVRAGDGADVARQRGHRAADGGSRIDQRPRHADGEVVRRGADRRGRAAHRAGRRR